MSCGCQSPWPQTFPPLVPIPANRPSSSNLRDSRAKRWARQVVCDPCRGWGWERVAFLDGSCFLNARAFPCFLFQIKKAYRRSMFESWDKTSPPGFLLLGLLTGQWRKSRLCRSSGCTIACASYGAQVLAGGWRHPAVPRGRRFSISMNGTAHPSVFFSISCSLVPNFTKSLSP